MATATMTIRCDENIKKEAAEVAKYYGFDLTSVTRAFWTYLARNRSIPLTFSEEPNEESLQAIKETKEILAKGGNGLHLKTAQDVLDVARNETWQN